MKAQASEKQRLSRPSSNMSMAKETRHGVLQKHLSDLEEENKALKYAVKEAEARIQRERQARDKMRFAIRTALTKQVSGGLSFLPFLLL